MSVMLKRAFKGKGYARETLGYAEELLKEQYLFLKQYNEDTDEIRILYLRNYYLLWKVFYKLKEIIAR